MIYEKNDIYVQILFKIWQFTYNPHYPFGNYKVHHIFEYKDSSGSHERIQPFHISHGAVPAGRFVKVVLQFVCLLIISLGIIISAFRPKELAFIGIIFGAVSLFIFLMYWNFRGLKITLINNFKFYREKAKSSWSHSNE